MWVFGKGTSGLKSSEVHFLIFYDRLADHFKLSLIKVQEAKKKATEGSCFLTQLLSVRFFLTHICLFWFM